MPRIFNILEITRISYANSDRSDQFRNKNTIFNLLLKVSTFKYIGTIKVSFGKKSWDVEIYLNKLEKVCLFSSLSWFHPEF